MLVMTKVTSLHARATSELLCGQQCTGDIPSRLSDRLQTHDTPHIGVAGHRDCGLWSAMPGTPQPWLCELLAPRGSD
eukprot:6427468-Amphidinium_carterae.1